MDGGGGGIATCSVCGRISASGGDHLDCAEMRRARLEDERIGAAARNELFGPDGGSRADGADLAVEMRAVLDHIGGGEGGAGAGQAPARRPSAPERSA